MFSLVSQCSQSPNLYWDQGTLQKKTRKFFLQLSGSNFSQWLRIQPTGESEGTEGWFPW